MHTLSRLFLAVPVLLASVQFVPAMAQDAPAAAPAAAEKVQLALSLPLNRTLAVSVEESMTTQTSMGGQESTSKVAVTMEYAATVVGVGAETKTTDLEMKYTRIHGDLDIPQMGPPGKFDSADPNVGADHPMAGSIGASMAPLIDSSLTLVFTPKAKVTEVKGADELAAKVLESNPQAAMQGDPAEDLREEMSNLFPELPSEGVAVGSTWKGQRSMSVQGVKFDLAIDYTVKSVSADEVAYTGKGAGTVEGGLMNGMIPITDPNVTVSGKIARKTGLTQHEKVALRATIDLSMMGGENGSFDVDRVLNVSAPQVAASSGEEGAKPADAPKKDDDATPPEGE